MVATDHDKPFSRSFPGGLGCIFKEFSWFHKLLNSAVDTYRYITNVSWQSYLPGFSKISTSSICVAKLFILYILYSSMHWQYSWKKLKIQGRSAKFKDFSRTISFSRSFPGVPQNSRSFQGLWQPWPLIYMQAKPLNSSLVSRIAGFCTDSRKNFLGGVPPHRL